MKITRYNYLQTTFQQLLAAGIVLVLAALAVFYISQPTQAAFYESGGETWQYRQKITIDAAQVDSTLSDFPVYVDLNDLGSGFFSNVNADGGDIRVTESDGSTEVAREVVSIDASANTGELHFKADSISATADTEFYIYYGNSQASNYAETDTFGAQNVWTNGFEAVYHLQEGPDQSSGTSEILDSTANNNDGTAEGAMTSSDRIAGHLGGTALDLDGSDDRINISGWGLSDGSLTGSMWVNGDSGEYTSGGTRYQFYFLGGGGSQYEFWGEPDLMDWIFFDGSGHGVSNVTPPAENSYEYITGTYDDSTGVFTAYNNASQLGQATDQTDTTFSGTASFIGDHPSQTRDLNAQVDEARFASVARSADWISAEYTNQNTPMTFYATGSQEADGVSTNTLEVRVSQSGDDAEECVADGGVEITSSDLELIKEPASGTSCGDEQEVGMRFQNISIPQGANITNAYIEFETDEATSTATSLTFHGENIDSAPTFTTTNGDISSRSTTAASFQWSDVLAWDTVNEKHQTPDLSTIVQEIVDRPGWASGNDMAIVVTGSGTRFAESYDGEPANAPLLHLEYEMISPTIVESTIKADGTGDYQTIAAWEAATDNDLIAANEIQVGVISDKATYAERVTIGGATTDSEHYRQLTVATSSRHDGTADSGPVVNPSTSGHVFTVNEDNFQAEWLEIADWSGGSAEAFRVNGDQFTLSHAIIHDSVNNDADGVYIGANGITANVDNSIFYDINRTSIHIQDKQNVTVNVRNVTAYNTTTQGGSYTLTNYAGMGFDQFGDRDNTGSVMVLENVTVQAVARDFAAGDNGGSFAGSDYNASADATAPGANSLTNVNQADQFVSVTDGAEDFHLQSGADLVDAGDDLAGQFATDIDGEDRTTNWDIGADERIVQIGVGGTTFGDNPSGTFADTDWQYRQKITIDAAQLDSNLIDFPVYVDLSDLGSSFFANVNADGGDIRMTEGDGTTQISREIVSVDTVGETGELHFKAPFLSASQDTDFYIYYGNAEAGDYADAATYGAQSVWTNGYEGVWHMQEDPSGGNILDSTANEHDGNPGGSGMTGSDSVAGRLSGNALDFDGADDDLNTGPTTVTGDMTISLWQEPDSLPAGGSEQVAFAGKFDGTNTAWELKTPGAIASSDGDTNFRFQSFDGTGHGVEVSQSNFSEDTWHYLVGTCGAGQWKLYDNGIDLNGTTYAQGVCAVANSSDRRIGGAVNSGTFFDGTLDEVRLATAERSGNWIAAEYANQNTPTSFYTAGAQQTEADAAGAGGGPATTSSRIRGGTRLRGGSIIR